MYWALQRRIGSYRVLLPDFDEGEETQISKSQEKCNEYLYGTLQIRLQVSKKVIGRCLIYFRNCKYCNSEKATSIFLSWRGRRQELYLNRAWKQPTRFSATFVHWSCCTRWIFSFSSTHPALQGNKWHAQDMHLRTKYMASIHKTVILITKIQLLNLFSVLSGWCFKGGALLGSEFWNGRYILWWRKLRNTVEFVLCV